MRVYCIESELICVSYAEGRLIDGLICVSYIEGGSRVE